MSFKVEPQILRDFAALLGRAEYDAEQCVSYFNKHAGGSVTPGISGGVFNPLYYEYDEVTSAVRGALDHMRRLLEAGQSEMDKVARYYEATDRAQAERVDNSYPEVNRPVPRKD